MHGRSHKSMTINPRIPKMPERNTSGFHRPDRYVGGGDWWGGEKGREEGAFGATWELKHSSRAGNESLETPGRRHCRCLLLTPATASFRQTPRSSGEEAFRRSRASIFRTATLTPRFFLANFVPQNRGCSTPIPRVYRLPS